MSNKSGNIPESEWVWFGSAGHFCCGVWCRFHLTTKVGKFLISTIGEYIHPRNAGSSEASYFEYVEKNYPGEDVGYGRKYETEVFVAGKPCEMPECMCGQPDIAECCWDMNGYNQAGEATKGHYEMCHKYAKAEYQNKEDFGND